MRKGDRIKAATDRQRDEERLLVRGQRLALQVLLGGLLIAQFLGGKNQSGAHIAQIRALFILAHPLRDRGPLISLFTLLAVKFRGPADRMMNLPVDLLRSLFDKLNVTVARVLPLARISKRYV